MNEVFCPNCGNKILAEEKFCSRCGSARPDVSSQHFGSSPSQTTYQAPAQPSYQVPSKPAAKKMPIALFIVSCVLLVGAIAFGVWKLWLNKPVLTPNNTFLAVNKTEPANTVSVPASTPVQTVLSTPPAKITAPPMASAAATIAPQQTSGGEPTSEQVLSYFLEVGVDSYDGYVKRWAKPIKVQIKGDYTDKDYEFIVNQLDMFNEFDGIPNITIVKTGGNFFVHFVPKSKMADIVEGYQSEFESYYNYYWSDNYEITKYVSVVNSDGTTQEERNYLALEMITRGLGFFNKSSTYADSIFRPDWTNFQKLCDMDYYMIATMYCDLIKPGMDVTKVKASLAN